jgi:mannose-6-phosphate isomerase-like protein (cupin superfamily)
MKKSPFIHQTGPYVVPRDDGKQIEEHFGRASTETSDISIARMVAPAGWSEPAQEPEFDEYIMVMSGQLRVTAGSGEEASWTDVSAGESLRVSRNTPVQYANPFQEECEYWSLCLPAFAPELAHIDKKD